MNKLNSIESVSVELSCMDVILGYQYQHLTYENRMINNVILNVKMYIWRSKLLNLLPSYNKLREWIERRKLFEKYLETIDM
jgi:hypothetical protein